MFSDNVIRLPGIPADIAAEQSAAIQQLKRTQDRLRFVHAASCLLASHGIAEATEIIESVRSVLSRGAPIGALTD